MLTDIFAYRYTKYRVWSQYTEAERRLLNQTIALAKEIYTVFDGSGKKVEANEAKWQEAHNRLARELGVNELAQRHYSFTTKGPMGQDWHQSGYWTYDYVCEQFVNAMPQVGLSNADPYIKERVSFIELVMRLRHDEVAKANADLPQALLAAKLRPTARQGLRVPGLAEDGVRAQNASLNQTFQRQVEELNERFRRAGAPLTFHNGFVQVATDEVIEREIASPFWRLVASPVWENVSIDMAEALDRRDSNDKDPAFFAGKALESAIKIVSDTKGWTRGKENGASAYIDNLVRTNLSPSVRIQCKSAVIHAHAEESCSTRFLDSRCVGIGAANPEHGTASLWRRRGFTAFGLLSIRYPTTTNRHAPVRGETCRSPQ
ncbi:MULTISPECIES: AbiJ-NTD4 domain-containing protein [Paraburkholderia]|uniref:AbiJ-NTD4 domain-containing protein n=1 Tax=Paraburkholderia TaxID=1822464 RepID=UPI00036D8CFF|nr:MULTISPECIES: hypothetical protein [Paraburkholderia]MDH6149529.1 hypothetical protein [Paraburkholderia sp. WSM4179]